MKRITHIGLDMDHTLIRYHYENFEELAHKVMLQKLVELKSYPKSILKLKFDYNRTIRGLVIDKNRGNILKLSRYAAIRVSQHGTQPIDYETQKALYKSTYIDLGDSNFDTVDTSFSVSFAGLFAQLVDLKGGSEAKGLPDFNTIASDLNYVLDKAHRDGSLKDVVRDNLSRYIIKDPDVVRGIQKYIKHGKKFFILTNSDFSYAKLLLDYAINPFLKDSDWQDIFEYTITLAQKPRFFYDNLRFLKIDAGNGLMTNVDGLSEPGVYQGGCASLFTSSLHLEPDQILYLGDHIYGDIVRLKKDCAWRTALVVEEIDEEIAKYKRAKPVMDKINGLMLEKIPLEEKIDSLISEKIENGGTKKQKEIEGLIQKVSAIDKKISPLIRKQNVIYNPYWGEVMRAGLEESYFAHQVERFACIYMAKLSDLLALSPRTYFRSFRRIMAHEVGE